MRRLQLVTLLTAIVVAPACGGGELTPCDHDPEPNSALPQLTSISPSHGEPGTTVTLRGKGFNRLDPTIHNIAYGDFSQGCDFATLGGDVVNDTEMQVTIPSDATLSGYLYLQANDLTVSRAPQRFILDVDPVGLVTVQNVSQFPVVSVQVSWVDVLEAGDRIDIEDHRTFTVAAGALHLRVCVGGPNSSGTNQEWACNVWEGGRLAENGTFLALVATLPAARFLEGAWEASWKVGEDTYVEDLRINGEGYWELRHGGRVVDSGDLIEEAWPAYSKEFRVGFHPGEALLQLQVPVNSFQLFSPRANDYVTFRRAEE